MHYNVISTWDIINEGGVASVPVKLTLEWEDRLPSILECEGKGCCKDQKQPQTRLKGVCVGGVLFLFCVCMHVCMYVHIHMCSVCVWMMSGILLTFSPVLFIEAEFFKMKKQTNKTSQSSPIKLVSLTSLPCCGDPRFPSGRPKPSGLSWETKIGSLYLYYKCLNTESSP